MPDPKAIKHEIADQEVQDRSHPVFNPLTEQFEIFCQTIQRLHRQQVLVKLPDQEQVRQVRTPNVPKARIPASHLEQWKRFLARQVGKPRATLEQEAANRAKRFGIPLLHIKSDPAEQPTPPPTLSADAFWV